MSDEQQKLLPIGTRVTHWDGGPNTWGKGTIIAYNQVEPSSYLKTNFVDAINMANEAGMLGGILGMMYDRTRCPYVVQWDIRVGDTELDEEKRKKYPRGYRDVYEHDSVRAYPNEDEPLNIFPNDWVRIMGRTWYTSTQAWSNWLMIDEEMYEKTKDKKSVEAEWQFCVRPLPVPRYRNSPPDGSFVPLTLKEGSTDCDLKGYHPPHGIFVEFQVHGETETRVGMTSQLVLLPPTGKWELVFITGERGQEKVFFVHDVFQWRELIVREKFTNLMLECLGQAIPLPKLVSLDKAK
jgi:hypothetical protein